MDATVSISLSELDTLRATIKKARQETAQVQAELDAERARPLDERLAETYAFIQAAKEVIDFAVGNLSPEFTRNWPATHLLYLATNVDSIGAVTSRDESRAQIWTRFHTQIVDFDRRHTLAANVNTEVERRLNDVKLPTNQELRELVMRRDDTPVSTIRRSGPWLVPWALGLLLLLGVVLGGVLMALVLGPL